MEFTARSPHSLTLYDFRLDGLHEKQRHLAVADDPVDSSAFTAAEEAFLRRFLRRSLPPAYVDAVIRYVSRSRKECVEDLEKHLQRRTRQLYQAVDVIEDLIRERRQLQSNAACLERTRSNLSKIRATLRGVQHQMLNRETTR